MIPPKGVLLTSFCGNTYGSNCVFGCESGYGSPEGNVTRTCLESSLWSGENIKCTGTGTSLRFYFCIKVRQMTNRLSKKQTTISNKIEKVSHHQNCVSSFAKGFVASKIISYDADPFFHHDLPLFLFLIMFFFPTYYLLCQIFFLHCLMSHVQPVLWWRMQNVKRFPLK